MDSTVWCSVALKDNARPLSDLCEFNYRAARVGCV
jgi:hypothetical protein